MSNSVTTRHVGRGKGTRRRVGSGGGAPSKKAESPAQARAETAPSAGRVMQVKRSKRFRCFSSYVSPTTPGGDRPLASNQLLTALQTAPPPPPPPAARAAQRARGIAQAYEARTNHTGDVRAEWEI